MQDDGKGDNQEKSDQRNFAEIPEDGGPNFVGSREHLAILRQGLDAWNAWRGENPEETPILAGADLSRVDFKLANLSGADLSRADLSRSNLSGADLFGADLSRADLDGANLSGANLSRSNMSGANLSRSNLSGAVLHEANLSSANLRWANADPSLAKPPRADLSQANLSGADLFEANLSRADLSRSNLSGAKLFGADLSRADLSRANLSGAKLSRSNLSGAGLIRSNLSGAKLSRSNLSGADLIAANLSGAALIAANLSGASLRGANCKRAVFRQATLTGADLRDARGLVLDENPIRDARLDPAPNARWPVLRSRYSGQNIVVNFILVLLFLGPMVLAAFSYDAYSGVLESVNQSGPSVVEQCRESASATLGDTLYGEGRLQCGTARIGALVFGVHNNHPIEFFNRFPWLVGALTIGALLFQLNRLYLTRQVGHWRDSEDLSGTTPARYMARIRERFGLFVPRALYFDLKLGEIPILKHVFSARRIPLRGYAPLFMLHLGSQTFFYLLYVPYLLVRYGELFLKEVAYRTL